MEDLRGTMKTKVERKSFKEGSNEVSSRMINDFEEETAIDTVIGNNQRKSQRLHQALLEERRYKRCILIAVLFIITVTAISTLAGPQKQLVDEYGYLINNNGGHKSDDSHKGGGNGGESVLHDEDEAEYEGYGEVNEDDQVKEDDLDDKYEVEDGLFEPSGDESQYEEGDDVTNDVEDNKEDDIEDDIGTYNNNNEDEDEEETTDIKEKFKYPEEGVQALIDNVNDLNIGDLTKRFGNIDVPFKNNGYMIPFLFYIPRTGAAVQEKMLVKCHGIVAATGEEAFGKEHGDEPVSASLMCSSSLSTISVPFFPIVTYSLKYPPHIYPHLISS